MKTEECRDENDNSYRENPNYKKIRKFGNVPAIYKIENAQDGLVYVGRTKKLRWRLFVHLWNLQKNKHIAKLMQEDFNRLGESCFMFDVLEFVRQDNLITREDYWMVIYQDKIGKYNYQRKATRTKPP